MMAKDMATKKMELKSQISLIRDQHTGMISSMLHWNNKEIFT